MLECALGSFRPAEDPEQVVDPCSVAGIPVASAAQSRLRQSRRSLVVSAAMGDQRMIHRRRHLLGVVRRQLTLCLEDVGFRHLPRA